MLVAACCRQTATLQLVLLDRVLNHRAGLAGVVAGPGAGASAGARAEAGATTGMLVCSIASVSPVVMLVCSSTGYCASTGGDGQGGHGGASTGGDGQGGRGGSTAGGLG